MFCILSETDVKQRGGSILSTIRHRLTALFLSAVMAVSAVPVYAMNSGTEETEVIVSQDDPEESGDQEQGSQSESSEQSGKTVIDEIITTYDDRTYSLDDAPEQSELEEDFPDTLDATADGEVMEIPITGWETDYNQNVCGTYTFTPVIGSDDYDLSGLTMPSVTVTIEEPESEQEGAVYEAAEQGKAVPYAAAGTISLRDGSTTQKEKTIGDGETFLADKYVTRNSGADVNGQYTYTTTIEQAVHSNNTIRTRPPEKQEIFLVLDASATMTDKVDSLNSAVRAFCAAVQKTNTDRISKWNSGYYTGTAGDSVNNHLLTIRAAVKYNNKVTSLISGSGITPTTSSDVDTICSRAKLYAGYEPNGSLQDMTRTDLALKSIQNSISDPKHSSVILMTDGEPYGRGAEGSFDYDSDTSTGIMMTYENANAALDTARSIKDSGAVIYSVYVQTGYPDGILDAAKMSRDIRKLATTSAAAGSASRADMTLGCAFLSLVSSDYPKNGRMHGTADPKEPGDYILTGTYDDPGSGYFGKYFTMPDDAGKIVDNFVDAAKDIDYRTRYNSGYAGASSYLYDVVSWPFHADTAQGVTVYQVPRICTGLDANGNRVFTWGEKENITDQVSVSLENGRFITVKGYDYEENALSDYSKTATGAQETYPSQSGDYGYKIVVEFPIYSNRIFGGNGIETNDSEISGFYPSVPTDNPSNTWNNSRYNDEKTDYVLLYPIPKVDLKIDYKVVSDNIVIYAPQTAKLQNLVTDANNRIFATDSNYETVKADYEAAMIAQNKALAVYESAAAEYTASIGSADESRKQAALEEAITAYNNAKTRFSEAQKAYDAVQSYVPDGENNAYVDIHYTLKDPSGKEIASMDISHGTDCSGSGSQGWKYSSGQMIKKHGTYTITATVTPVDTTREESHTGSSREGTGKPTDFTASPWAHIYVLQATGTDSMVESKQGFSTLDDTPVSIDDVAGTTWMSENISDLKWVGLDGKTPADHGDAVPDSAGSGKAQGTQPSISLRVADKTYVTGQSGSYVANGDDGAWIPVAAQIYRQTGDLNKDTDVEEAIRLKKSALNDDDELYEDANGNKVSSVVWKHVCDSIPDCDNTSFSIARKYDSMDETVQNKIRFLIHVHDEIVMPVKKDAKKSAVKKDSPAVWTINISNTDSDTNPDKMPASASVVDVLPYNGDGRMDPETGETTGSSFSGTLKVKYLKLDLSQSDTSRVQVFYTTDTSVRAKEDNDYELKTFAWQKASLTGTGANVTAGVPEDAVAIMITAKLDFGQRALAELSVQAENPSVGDKYQNKAVTLYNTKRTETETTKVTVATSFISGLIWEDKNANGVQDTGEQKISGVRVGLYTAHNPSGPGAAITINGVQYDTAFNADGEAVNQISTGADGSYKFENLKPGTYVVAAQDIDGSYTVTKKHAVSNTETDSDAEQETTQLTNLNAKDQPVSGKTGSAWIKDIVLTDEGSREHMDIGLVQATGRLKLIKTLDQIYFPSTMTEEEKSQYYPTFHFTLTGPNGKKYYKTAHFSEMKLKDTVLFEDLPLGTYTLQEDIALNYHLDSIESEAGMTADVNARTVTFTITAAHPDLEVTFHNMMNGIPPAGDQNQVINHIPMHKPVSLKVTYSGPKLIESATATRYSFRADQIQGVVTYDDGSTQNVTIGSTGFTLSPQEITNTMNTNGNNAKTVHAYYTEKGVTLEDSFSVRVNLKPTHKFQVVYHANGSTFANGSDTNTIYYLYDQVNDTFYSYSGTYAQPNGRGSDFTFMGWSTSPNGAAGTKYDNEAALKSAAVDDNVTRVDLYARWLTYYVLNGNGGTVNPTRIQAYYGDYIPASPSASASRSGYNFEGWFSSPNLSSGKWLSGMTQEERKITGPRTFYAVWSKSHFTYVGHAVQEFTAIQSGTYQITAYGSAGGGDLNNDYGQKRENVGGNGGRASGRIYLQAGQKLYVCVGSHGPTPCSYSDDREWAGSKIDYSGDGWNGGGGVGGDGQSGVGGGATSITTTNRGVLSNFANYQSEVLVVAGGGGGGSYDRNGGAGGSGGGYQFGYGETGNSGGGGGGGWSGGRAGYDDRTSANGGTSYVSPSMTNGSQQAGGGAGYHSNGWCDIVRVGN